MLYTLDAKAAFYVKDNVVFPVGGGDAEYFVSDRWLFTLQGKASFYYVDS